MNTPEIHEERDVPTGALAERAREPLPYGPKRLPIWRWRWEGTRASFFLRPRVADATPSPWQVLAVFALVQVVMLLVSRVFISGPAEFLPNVWFAVWWPY